jgi:hypothetical protein
MKTNGISVTIVLNLSILFISIYIRRYSLEIIIAGIGIQVRPTPPTQPAKKVLNLNSIFITA